jgi:hypothetical protein
MNRLVLPALAFLVVPVLLVLGGEAFARLPWIYAVLHRLPYLSNLPFLSFQYGLTPPDPAPLFATAIGIGGFLLSSHCYAESDPLTGAALRRYLRLLVFRCTLILGSATFVLLFAQWYLRLPLSLSLLAALGVGYYLFRWVTAARPVVGPQGVGRTTAEVAERQRTEVGHGS